MSGFRFTKIQTDAANAELVHLWAIEITGFALAKFYPETRVKKSRISRIYPPYTAYAVYIRQILPRPVHTGIPIYAVDGTYAPLYAKVWRSKECVYSHGSVPIKAPAPGRSLEDWISPADQERHVKSRGTRPFYCRILMSRFQVKTFDHRLLMSPFNSTDMNAISSCHLELRFPANRPR
jgi:hypothetical protein